VRRIAFVVVALMITVLFVSSARAQQDLARLARQGYDISADQASHLEESLTRDPNDLTARAQLLGFYFAAGGRHSQVSPEVARQARLRHILWLVQNHPELELMGMSVSTIDPTGTPLADEDGYEKVKALWLEQTEKHKDNPEVLANASWFFKLPDKPIAAQLLKRAQTVDPGNRNWSAGLGLVYAAGIVGLTGMNENGFATRANPDEARGPFAEQAREELAKSQDAALLGTAGYRLWFWGTILNASGEAPPDYRGLSEQLLSKAQALDPANPQWAEVLARVHAQSATKAALPDSAQDLAWTDPATGLMWTRMDNGTNVNWKQAGQYCGKMTVGGHSDWRLPTIDELSGLYDPKQNVGGYNIKGGIRLSNCCPWSSTLHDPEQAYLIHFIGGGRIHGRLDFTFHALCVRSLGK